MNRDFALCESVLETIWFNVSIPRLPRRSAERMRAWFAVSQSFSRILSCSGVALFAGMSGFTVTARSMSGVKNFWAHLWMRLSIV